MALALANRIRIARRHAGLSQQRLAEGVGVTRGAVSNWESANSMVPASRHLLRIALHTGVSHEWLASGRGLMVIRDSESEAGEWITDQEEIQMLRAFRLAHSKARTMMFEIASLAAGKRKLA